MSDDFFFRLVKEINKPRFKTEQRATEERADSPEERSLSEREEGRQGAGTDPHVTPIRRRKSSSSSNTSKKPAKTSLRQKRKSVAERRVSSSGPTCGAATTGGAGAGGAGAEYEEEKKKSSPGGKRKTITYENKEIPEAQQEPKTEFEKVDAVVRPAVSKGQKSALRMKGDLAKSDGQPASNPYSVEEEDKKEKTKDDDEVAGKRFSKKTKAKKRSARDRGKEERPRSPRQLESEENLKTVRNGLFDEDGFAINPEVEVSAESGDRPIAVEQSSKEKEKSVDKSLEERDRTKESKSSAERTKE